MSATRLMCPQSVQDEVQAILDKACTDPETLPGAVFVMMDRKGRFLAKAAAGIRGLDVPDHKMTTDTAFVGFSCTKLITAIACMQLVEQDKLQLDAPVDSLLPELANMRLVDGSAAKRKITLRMLVSSAVVAGKAALANRKPVVLCLLAMDLIKLSHTAGFAYTFFNEKLYKWTTANQQFNNADWETYKQPLVAQPGEDWNYGINIDWAGKLVERATGQTIGQYCKNYIFDPLGCKDIDFNRLPSQCADRFASIHTRLASGKVVRIEHQPVYLQGKLETGGAGCVFTAEEYIKILFILINGGRGLNGVQILEPRTIDEMFIDQLAGTPAGLRRPLERTMPAVIPQLTNPVVPIPNTEKGWSFAGMLTKDPLPTGRSANSVWWAGLGNLYWMADREKGLVNMILTQYFPFHDRHTLNPYRAAEKAVYDSLQ